MVVTGGGALLRDLDRLLMEETGLPVLVAEDPLTCVVRGSGRRSRRWRSSATSSPTSSGGRHRGKVDPVLADPGRSARTACTFPPSPPLSSRHSCNGVRATAVLPSWPGSDRAHVLRAAVGPAHGARRAVPLRGADAPASPSPSTLQQLAIAPVSALSHSREFFATQTRLRRENNELRGEKLKDAEALLALESVRAENEQLKRLLAARGAAHRRLDLRRDRVRRPRPLLSRKVIIDRGGQHGIALGRR